MEFNSGSEGSRQRSPRKGMIVWVFVMVAVVLGVVLVVNSRDNGYTRKVVAESGEKCILPFDYGGKTFNECTSYENDRDWCAVYQSADKLNMRWSYCPIAVPDELPPACDPDELDKLKKENDDLRKALKDCRDDLGKCQKDEKEARRCCSALDTCNNDLDKCRDDYGRANKCCSDLDTCRGDLAKCPKVVTPPPGPCANGIIGPTGMSCCPKSCGQCGGLGCDKRPGGPGLCCDQGIASTGHPCKDNLDTGCFYRKCTKGVASSLSCCPLSCGTCGGAGCNKRPGGVAKCCDQGIEYTNNVCDSPEEVACSFKPYTSSSLDGVDQGHFKGMTRR